MSTGLAICSACKREVHQDGPLQTWTHCVDKSPLCQAATSIYPSHSRDIVGPWCGQDGSLRDADPGPGLFDEPQHEHRPE